MPAVGLATEKNTALYVPRLSLLPEAQGYVLSDGPSFELRDTRGGVGRTRLDKKGTSAYIDAQWNLDRNDYSTLKDFYEEFFHIEFRMSLLVDQFTLTEHDVKFVPSTFSLVEHSGESFIVRARLEVKLLPTDDIYNLGLVDIYGAYQEGSQAFLDALAIFANATLEANL